MKYKPWNLSTLKERLKYYKQLLNNTDNVIEQNRLCKTIESYNEFIQDYSIPYKKYTYNTISRIDQETILDIPETLEILLQANNFLLSNKITLDDELFSINTSKEKILTTTKSFYTLIGGIYKEKYDEYYSTNGIYINFKNNISNNQCGNILRPSGVSECFINIMLLNSPFDIESSIHEHSHAIAASICEEHANNSFINEVEAIFFELIFLSSLDKQQYTNEQINNLKEVTIGSYNHILNSIDAKYITTVKGISNINRSRFIISDKYSFDEQETDDIIYSPLNSYINYGFSFLVAIELFYIYKRFESKALNILEEIIREDVDEDIPLLKFLQDIGINPGNNIKRFYKENIKGISLKH